MRRAQLGSSSRASLQNGRSLRSRTRLGLRILEKGVLELTTERDARNPRLLDLFIAGQEHRSIGNQGALGSAIVKELLRVLNRCHSLFRRLFIFQPEYFQALRANVIASPPLFLISNLNHIEIKTLL